MAASGYTPILIYASGTTGNTPLAANLTSSASGAELALNYFDGKLFYKDSGGTVQVLATKGTAAIGGSNTQVQYNSSGSLAGSANMTFDGTKLTVAGLKDSALTSGRVTYATTSGELTDSANLTFNGTNLGLGISSTNDTFVIYSATTPGVRFYNSTTGTLSSDGSQIYVSGNDFLLMNRESAAVYTGTANTIRTTLDASGSFGINTMTPGATLDVNGTATISGNVTFSGGTANGVLYLNGSKVATSGSALTFDGSKFTVLPTGAGGGELFKVGFSGGSNYVRIGAYSGYGEVFSESGNMVFGASGANSVLTYTNSVLRQSIGSDGTAIWNVAGSEQMRLNSTGLGIGTSSPSAKLDVNGTIYSRTGGLYSDNITAYSGSSISVNAGSSYFAVTVNSSEQMRLTSTGLGIGTTSPLTKLQVAGAKALASGTYGSSTQLIGTYIGESTDGNLYAEVDMRRWTGASTNHGAGRISVDASANMIFFANVPSTNTYATTELMRLNSTGLGIGTSSPSGIFNIKTSNGQFLVQNGTSAAQMRISAFNNAGNANAALIFEGYSTEYGRFDSSGTFLVGTTSPSITNSRSVFQQDTTNYWSAALISDNRGLIVRQSNASGGIAAYFEVNSGTNVGSINTTSSATSYATSSDYRLKENQQPLTGSGAFIDALKPKTWNWKVDGSVGVGFIAHEVQEVSPNSVVGEKDGEQMQAMEYGSAEFIANIIAELQSLRARVAQLEAKGA